MLLAKIKTLGMSMILLLGASVTLGLYFTGGTGSVPDFSPAASAQERPADPAQPKKEQRDKERANEPFGLVKAIDLKVGTLTISSLRDGDRGEVTFSLAAKDLKVGTTFGEPIKLADVTPGMRVHLQLRGDDVISLRVENPVVPAFLNSIDVEKRTVEARAERMIVSYHVAPDARITINGKPAKLAAVPIDQRLFLTLSFDKKAILALHNTKAGARDGERPGVENPKGDRPAPPRAAAAVTLLDFDADKRTVQLLVPAGGDLLDIKTIALAKDCKLNVVFDERTLREITLAELAKPVSVIVRLSDDGKTATAVSVLTPTLRGAIVAIDGKKVTIRLDNREERSLELDPGALLRLPGRADAKLADLAPGMNVIVGLSLDRRQAVAISVLPKRDGDR